MEFSSGLRAAVDRVIPQDDRPGLGRGVAAYVAASPDLGWAADALLRLDKLMEELAAGRSFVDLAPEHQDELLNILGFRSARRRRFRSLAPVSRSRATTPPAKARPLRGLICGASAPCRRGSSRWSRTSCRTSASAACGATMTRSLLAVAPGGGVAAQSLAQAGRRGARDRASAAIAQRRIARRSPAWKAQRRVPADCRAGGRSPARRTAPRRRPRSRRARRRFALRLERERDGWWHETVAGNGLAIPAGGLPDGLGLRQP